MKSSGIGGQAVLEGVMMKNKEKYAVAVRKPNQEIVVNINEYHPIGERIPILKLPILRGVVIFVESLVVGMKTLMYSAEFAEEEEDTKETSKHTKNETIASISMVLISILLAVTIFMMLPYVISQLLNRIIPSQTTLTVIEGVLRIGIFVGYVVIVSRNKDIKRVFMYHGAEHKTINCLENGFELTVENVQKQPKYHRRCGTSFLLIVIVVSVILFMFIRVSSPILRLGLRLLLVPVISGISYELIRIAGNTEGSIAEIKKSSASKGIQFLKIVRFLFLSILTCPGKWMQSLTTKEPEDSMIEVAIASVNAVFDWKAYLAELEKEQRKGDELKQLEPVLEVTKKNEVQESAAAQEDKEEKPSFLDLVDKGEEEEDDEVLRALDRYFIYQADPESEDDKKKGTIRF